MRSLTAAALRSPAAVAVGVAVAILFGAFALYSLLIQLFPDIDRPQIGIELRTTQIRAQAGKSRDPHRSLRISPYEFKKTAEF